MSGMTLTATPAATITTTRTAGDVDSLIVESHPPNNQPPPEEEEESRHPTKEHTTNTSIENTDGNRPRTNTDTTAATTESTDSTTSNHNHTRKKKKKLWKRVSRRHGWWRRSSKRTTMEEVPLADTIMTSRTNPVQWLPVACPPEVVAKVLCFVSPVTTQALMQTNTYWYRLLRASNQATWRTLCEGLYKWQEGRDPLPTVSWKDYYRLHPCVPVDYPTIPQALAVAAPDYDDHHKIVTAQQRRPEWGVRTWLSGRGVSPSRSADAQGNSPSPPHGRSVHILLRPGIHVLEESLVVDTASRDAVVTISTLEMPPNRFYSARRAYAEREPVQSCPAHLAATSTGESSPGRRRRRHTITSPGRPSLRQLVNGCRSVEGVVEDSADQPMEEVLDGDEALRMTLDGVEEFRADAMHPYNNNNNNNFMSASERGMRPATPPRPAAPWSPTYAVAASSTTTAVPPYVARYPTRARLALRTRKTNEPILRVRQGRLRLAGLDLDHASRGADIWNGNAAVQIQPRPVTDQEAPVIVRPSAVLHRVAVSSQSGRGVVCLDGGYVQVEDSMIFDCAATGLYVGGPGSSEAAMRRSDVIRNGIGSRLPYLARAFGGDGRIVSAGHSGVYLEQGKVTIEECNISSNNLTGISAVSHDNAALVLRDSDLVANGQVNIERPPPGTPSFRLSDIANTNHIAAVGRPCLRSNLDLSFLATEGT